MLKKVSLWLSEATSPCHVQKAAEDFPLPIFFCFALKDQRPFFCLTKPATRQESLDLPAAEANATVGSKRLPEFISRREKVVGSFHRFHMFFLVRVPWDHHVHFGSSTALCFLAQHLAQKAGHGSKIDHVFPDGNTQKSSNSSKSEAQLVEKSFFWTRKASWKFH